MEEFFAPYAPWAGLAGAYALRARAPGRVLVGRTPERFSVKGRSLDAITPPRITPGLPSSIKAA